MNLVNKKAVIVGAGYGGMALANLLAKKGYSVDVYEKNEAAGGRIHAVKKDGYTFDLGPSWYLMPEVFEQYYALFDKSAQHELDLIRFSPGYKVFFEHNDPLTVMGDTRKDKDLFESIEPGAGKRLEAYMQRSTMIYETALKYFLYTTFNSLKDIFRWDVIKQSPLMITLLFLPLDRYVSRFFNDRRLKQMLEYHMVFLGTSPFKGPAMYSLMSHLDFKSGVFYPRKGMLSLADNLREVGESVGVTYHFNQPVQSINVEGKVAKSITLSNGKVIEADIVISNADLHFTETKLLQAEDQTYPESYWDKRETGPGSLLISFGVGCSLDTLLHHNLYFVDEWKQNFDDIYENKILPEHASLYVCNPTKTDPSLAPAGKENIFVLMPFPAGVTLDESQKKQLLEKTITILARMTDKPELAQYIESSHIFGPEDFGDRYNAWQYNAFGGESHVLFQSAMFRTKTKSKKVSNLYYVGAGTQPGIGLPMCLIGASIVFRNIVGSKASGPLSKEELL